MATGRQVTRERAITPSSEASNWPIMAAMKTRMMATSACWRGPVHQELGHGRGERGAHGRAGQEPDAAEHADDEALPVSGDGEGRREHDQDQIEQVSRHPPTV